MIPINLGQRGTSFGGRRLPQAPNYPAAPQQQPKSPQEYAREAQSYGLAEALDSPIEIQSGSPVEAIAEALAGGLRGRAARTQYQGELSRADWASALEQKQQGAEADEARRMNDARIAALQPEQWSDPQMINGVPVPVQRNERSNQYRTVGSPPPTAGQLPAPGMPVQGAAGYVWGEGGTQRPAPGGPADRRVNQEQAQRARAALARIEDQQNVMAAIDRATELAGSGETGAVGAVMRGVPGTRAFDLDAQLDIIRANIGFDALMEMRANSPTGGALGAVTERELALLQSTLEALNQAQSREQFLAGLTRLRTTYASSMQRIRQAYEQDFGDGDIGATASEPQQGGGNVIRYDAQGNRIP